MNNQKSKYTPRQAASLLKQCRQENITYEMAMTAMSEFGCENLIQYVPLKLRTDELFLQALRYAENKDQIFIYIPKDIITTEFILKAVKRNGILIKKFAPEMITEQIALSAIENNLNAIKYVPHCLITQSFCEQIITLHRDCLKYVPQEFRTKEFLLKAVEAFPWSIKHIKKEELSDEICKYAVSKKWQTLDLIPEEFKSNEICDIAIKANPSAVKYASNNLKTPELCLKMIRKNPKYISKCPKDILTEDFLIHCIEANWICIEYIPDDLKTQKLCSVAIDKSPYAIHYTPTKFLSEGTCLNAVKKDASIIKLLPDEYITKSLCEIAIKFSPDVITYVPEKFRTIELYVFLLSGMNFSNYFMSWLLDDELYPSEQYLINNNLLAQKELIFNDYHNFNTFKKSVYLFSNDIISNPICAKHERALNLRIVQESEYDNEQQLFIVYELFCKNKEIKIFKNFDDYYNYLDGDLTGANLIEFNIENVDNKKYNLTGAIFSSKVLKNQGTYDDTFYRNNICAHKKDVNFLPALINETVPACSISHTDIFNDKLNPKERKIYYITDLHLNHRLLKAFPSCATYDEVRYFIRKIIRKMISNYNINSDDFLLIGGDVSFSFEISKLFYSELTQFWSANRIIAILGNHELWNFNKHGINEQRLSLNEIIKKYSNLFRELNIVFLHNSLLLGKFNKYGFPLFLKVEYEKLLSLSIDQLKKIGLTSNLFILGSLGFSGYNSAFNATNGIYRQTITMIEDDLKLTKQFEDIYLKLAQVFPNDKVIVLTHTPKEDWTKNESYNPNWIYVNGHTHKNYYTQNENKTVYADNQIGYSSMNYNLKYFKLSKDYNIFKDYIDGIHKITKEQYIEFNYGIGISISFSRNFSEIVMLKHNGYFLFLAQNDDKSRLYLLNGGVINRLKNTDLNYYFVNMTKYGEVIKANLKSYNSALKTISEKIKLLGGDGTVHGCIVDIDFYNHIYLNPYDGSVTPYYSPSMGIQQIYSDIPKLLENHCPMLFNNYLKLIATSENSFALDFSKTTNSDSFFVHESEQYKPSRLIKNLQFITENSVIRLWNEDFIAGKEIDFSEEVKHLKEEN